jgi:hypothetical protein
MALTAVVPVLASCGGSGAGDGDAAIGTPSRPSVNECGVGSVSGTAAGRTRKRSTDSVPAPGVYRYDVAGRQDITGAALRARDLPARGETLVSPSRSIGRLVCFRIQRRFAPDIANTETYVIRGGEIYVVGILIQALGETQYIRPEPAVLSATESASEWSGRFGGRTYGSYSFTVLSKGRFRVGTRRLRAVKISSSVSYRGAFRGTQDATTWISVDHGVVLGERARSSQGFGVSTLRLRSRSHLISLHPRPLPSS